MNITYVGRNNECYGNENPIALIGYDEEKETSRADRVFESLQSAGWEVFVEEGMAVIPLPFGRDQYDDLKADYMNAKKRQMDNVVL